MKSKIRRTYVVSRTLDNFFGTIFELLQFIGKFFRELAPPFERKEIIRQCYYVGYKSLPLISVTSFVVGIVFTKQSRPSLAEFGATSWLPSLVAIAIFRALAPLVTALIAAGKIGSNIGAELGSMRVTEQIDAMEVSATNPFKFLVVSRVLATTLMLPVLMFYMGFISMLGAYLNILVNEHTSFTTFFIKALEKITFLDMFSSLIKTFIFGFSIGIIGTYQGYNAKQGTLGVGRAANAAVVASMFTVFIEEIIIVQITNWFR
jgi:phospholipid/cholesterol/gamma-HCH transport system permease protein